jgi:flagellar FliJ protein
MAKRFRFRLAPLLKIREAKKTEAQRKLGKLMGELQLLQDKLTSLKTLQNESFQRRSVGQGNAVDLEMWRSIERFLVSLERRIEETNVDIERVQGLVEIARQELTVAHREHLTLVRLKERRQEQYNFEVAKEEQQQADELAVLRYQYNSPRAS